MSFPTNRLNNGSNNSVSAKASSNEIKACTRLSARNCTINVFRFAPVTFLTPTSLNRWEARAVDKVIKLNAPMKMIKAASIVNR